MPVTPVSLQGQSTECPVAGSSTKVAWPGVALQYWLECQCHWRWAWTGGSWILGSARALGSAGMHIDLAEPMGVPVTPPGQMVWL